MAKRPDGWLWKQMEGYSIFLWELVQKDTPLLFTTFMFKRCDN